MVRDRVMDIGGDSLPRQGHPDPIAHRRADHVEVCSVVFTGNRWKPYARAVEKFGIQGVYRSPAAVPILQARQFDGENGRLHLVEAAVAPLPCTAVVLLRPAVLPEGPDAFGKDRIAGRDGAPISQRAEILCGI